jgi:hypothetical protein
MKNRILAVLFMGMLSLSTHAISECTSDMNAEIMAECITIEGSGTNYQDWSKNYKGRTNTAAAKETDTAQSPQAELGALGIEKNK